MRGFLIGANRSLESDVINLTYIRTMIKIRQKGEDNTHFVPREVTEKDEIRQGSDMLLTTHKSLFYLYNISNKKLEYVVKYLLLKLIFCCGQHCSIAFTVRGIMVF